MSPFHFPFLVSKLLEANSNELAVCQRDEERVTSPLSIVRTSDVLVYFCSMFYTHVWLLVVGRVLSWLSEQSSGLLGGLWNVLGVLRHKKELGWSGQKLYTNAY